MKILEKINNYINESFKDQSIKRLRSITKMTDSDKKDDLASKLMDDIEKYRADMNKNLSKSMGTKEHAQIYNSNIEKSKVIVNLIGDIIDSDNPSDKVKKVEKLIKEWI